MCCFFVCEMEWLVILTWKANGHIIIHIVQNIVQKRQYRNSRHYFRKKCRQRHLRSKCFEVLERQLRLLSVFGSRKKTRFILLQRDANVSKLCEPSFSIV
jgi:hypothetical protein